MTTENNTFQGNLKVRGTFTLNGVVTGNIAVYKGAKIELNGTCAGTLFVEKGGVATINGVVACNVENAGVVHLQGVVKGDVRNSAGGQFLKSPDAIVVGSISDH